MGWIIPALSLGLSAGSSLFNISQSLKNQRDQKEQFREQMRQRATDLRTQATNYSGDTNAMLRHLFGEGGVTASMEDTQKQLDRYYNDAESQLQNLFNYAGMSGPRADVMVDQLRRQREEDLSALEGDYSQQLAQGQQDILTNAYNTYQSRLEAQGGSINEIMEYERTPPTQKQLVYGAGHLSAPVMYIDPIARAATFFQRNPDFVEGAVEMASSLREGRIGKDVLKDANKDVREAAEWGELFNKVMNPEDVKFSGSDFDKLEKMGYTKQDLAEQGSSGVAKIIRNLLLQENAERMS